MEKPFAGSKTGSCVTFEINHILMGIDILAAGEIHPLPDITPVQHSSDHIQGLINIRGRIVTAVDPGVLMGMPMMSVSEESHIVILKYANIGFMVDRIRDVVPVSAQDFEPVPANMNQKMTPYMDHVIHMQPESFILLSVEKILRKVNG